MHHDAAPARVTVTFPDGTVTLLPKRAPVGNSGPIRGETLTALPLGTDQPDARLDDVQRLIGQAFAHAPAVLELPDGSTQPGLALLGLTQAEAELLGGRLGLVQVFFWDGRRAALLDCPSSLT